MFGKEELACGMRDGFFSLLSASSHVSLSENGCHASPYVSHIVAQEVGEAREGRRRVRSRVLSDRELLT